MKNVFGSAVTVTLFGESHGAAIGAVLDGLAPGIPVDPAQIAARLTLRRPFGSISTARQEPDPFELVSGVYQGRTTGTPLCILIPNQNTKSADYAATADLARPGHADYTARCKYHGYEDPRGGGHFSGRLTAALVAAGAIAAQALAAKGIRIGTHIARCGGVDDRPFEDLDADLRALETLRFAALDADAAQEMQARIQAAAAEGDSVGGVLETAVLGLPAGVGEPWFDTLESVLAHGLFAIPGVKGVAFGGGFDLADARGSDYNDPMCMEHGRVVTTTNHNGGVNGGISNGMPLLFRCAVKPTPSIFKPQETVNLATGENARLQLQGRHDPAIVHRVRAVADAMTALTLFDQLTLRFGTDYFAGAEGAAL